MNKKRFLNIIIAIIVGNLIILGSVFVIVKRYCQPVGQLSQQNENKESLFGIMLASDINEAARVTPDILDAIRQKGWTEFRKDESNYQNLLSNLEKIIQDRAKLVKTTGFHIDREAVAGYFTWNVIEPQKGQFDWELTDIYAKGTSNAGVKISAVIQPFAGWDQKDTEPEKAMADFAYYDYKAGPPKDIAEYQNFLMKMVERYMDKVAVWEIGNELENQGSGYQNNPEGYFDLVKITSETIKKADPKAIVTNGGAMEIAGMAELNPFKTYWTKFFTLGGGQYIDYFNIHYNIERSPGAKLNPAMFQEELTFFNDLMDKNGGRKPLYLTEFGIYSGSPSSKGSNQPLGQPAQGQGLEQSSNNRSQEQPSAQTTQEQTLRNVSENDQAVLYFKDSILAFANGTKVVFIDLVGSDDGVIGSSMAFNSKGQQRLFLTSLKTIDSKIKGFSKVEKISDGQYKFIVNGKSIYVLWGSGKAPAEISGRVTVTDLTGQTSTSKASKITLSDSPIYVETK